MAMIARLNKSEMMANTNFQPALKALTKSFPFPVLATAKRAELIEMTPKTLTM